jgi:hypothetical protein
VAEGTKPCLLFAGETFADATNQGTLGAFIVQERETFNVF